MITATKRSLPAWLPYAIGAVLVVQFAGLGVWQISRGLDKRADRIAFREQSTFSQFQDGTEVRPYQSIKVDGLDQLSADPTHQERHDKKQHQPNRQNNA